MKKYKRMLISYSYQHLLFVFVQKSNFILNIFIEIGFFVEILCSENILFLNRYEMAEIYLIQIRENTIKPMSDVFFNKVNFY